MDQAVLPPRSRASGNAQPNFIKPAESLPSQGQGGPTCRSTPFEDPLTASPSSYADPTANDLLDDVMKTEEGLDETSPHLDEIIQKVGIGPGPGGDTSECSENKMAASIEPIDAVMAEIDRAVKMECMEWTHVFMESEQFEVLSSDHVGKLLEDAKALEENLIEQKERLLSHLKHLSQTLKLP